MRSEAGAVLGREAIVLAEDVALDLDDAAAGQTGDLLAGRVRRAIDEVAVIVVMIVRVIMIAVIVVMVAMCVMMAVVVMIMVMVVAGMIMVMIMSMRMMVAAMIMMMISGLDRSLAVTAATHRTHHSTSSSLTRMSSPPVTCS